MDFLHVGSRAVAEVDVVAGVDGDGIRVVLDGKIEVLGGESLVTLLLARFGSLSGRHFLFV